MRRAPVFPIVLRLFALASTCFSVAACGGARAPVSEPPRPEARSPRATVAPASDETRASSPDTRAPEPQKPGPEPKPAEAKPAAATFPPKDFSPPSQKSAAPGDGQWTPFGDSALGERAAAEPRAVVRTVVHPHPDGRFIAVTIAAMDLRRLAVHLVPGTDDLAWAKLGNDGSGGLVPADDRHALVVVMNGGFMPKHGRWGLAANGVVVTPARKEGCTVALYGDGSVRIGPWPSLADSAAGMKSYRQTPPCILESGAVHPLLLKGQDKAWAGHAADLTTRRRSAIGIDAANATLFYAIGEEASPRWLAEALRTAGATSAAELDINWYWTRFLAFGNEGGELHVTSTLIPKMEHLRTEYVARPSSRDFFYVTAK